MALTRKQIADVLWALSEAREHLDGEIDVVDGDYGAQEPNQAMVICQQLDEAYTLMEREFDALSAPAEPFPSSSWHGG